MSDTAEQPDTTDEAPTPTPGGGQTAAEPVSAQTPTPVPLSEAETVLREAVGAVDRPVPDATHTVDALVDALSARQWLSTKEDGELRRFLRQVLPGLAHLPVRRIGRTRRERRAASVRPAALEELLDVVAEPDHRGPDDVTDCLVDILTLPADLSTDPERLRQALTLLVDTGTPVSPPPGGPEHASPPGMEVVPLPGPEHASAGIELRPAGTPQAGASPLGALPARTPPPDSSIDRTVEELGKQVLRATYHAADRLLDAREVIDSVPAWALSVLADAVRDSVWLDDTDVVEPLTLLFDQFGFGALRRVTLSATVPAGLDAAVVASVRNAALALVRTLPERAAGSTPRDHASVAYRLVDTLSQISREVVGEPHAPARERAVADLRTVVSIVFLPAAGPAAGEAERRAAFARRVTLEERNVWLERQLRAVAEALASAANEAAAAFRHVPPGSNLAPCVQQWFLSRFPAGLVGIDVSHVVSALDAHLTSKTLETPETHETPEIHETHETDEPTSPGPGSAENRPP